MITEINKLKATRMECVEARSLRIHPRAQRRLVISNVKRIVKNLNLDAIGVVHAVDYPVNGENGLWVVDGQTRIHALIDVGLGEYPLDVAVHFNVKDDPGAAELFLWLNATSSVEAFDKWENQVEARHPDALGVLRIASMHGLEISRIGADGHLSCITALMKIYGIDDGRTLMTTLDSVIAAWGRTASACEGKVLEGIALVFKTYSDAIELPVLVKKLSKYPGGASALIGDAKGIRDYRKTTLPRCVAERVIDTYNSGRRSDKLDPL